MVGNSLSVRFQVLVVDTVTEEVWGEELPTGICSQGCLPTSEAKWGGIANPRNPFWHN